MLGVEGARGIAHARSGLGLVLLVRASAPAAHGDRDAPLEVLRLGTAADQTSPADVPSDG